MLQYCEEGDVLMFGGEKREVLKEVGEGEEELVWLERESGVCAGYPWRSEASRYSRLHVPATVAYREHQRLEDSALFTCRFALTSSSYPRACHLALTGADLGFRGRTTSCPKVYQIDQIPTCQCGLRPHTIRKQKTDLTKGIEKDVDKLNSIQPITDTPRHQDTSIAQRIHLPSHTPPTPRKLYTILSSLPIILNFSI
jgi:hypothetical protein